MNQNDSQHTFASLRIPAGILNVLTNAGFTIPTPIQEKSIPHAREGADLIGIAQTGTGKTLAFGIPMIEKVLAVKGAQGLVVVPTRELAIQVNDSLRRIGNPLGIRTAVLIGGDSMFRQKRALEGRPHIIVATPGRIIDHMGRSGLRLNAVSTLVLDEADRMLDMGFMPQIKRILEALPKEGRQTLLFSATMPEDIAAITKEHMKLPVRVEIAPAGKTSDLIEQEVFFVGKDNKIDLLASLLKENSDSALVFTRTKFGAKKIAHVVREMGHTSAEIHSNRSLAQRRDAIQGLKSGKYRVLVATDIAARGIDIADLPLVVNFDLPMKTEDYVHRIGRTGRAGKQGKAVSFAMPDEIRDIRDIERLIRMEIPKGSLPVHIPAPRPVASPERSVGSRPFGNRPGQRGFGAKGGGFKPRRFSSKPGGFRNSGSPANRPARKWGTPKFRPAAGSHNQ